METPAVEPEAEQKPATPASDAPNSFLVKALKTVLWPIFKILWRVEYRGVENIPHTRPGGMIVASNHQTYLDPFWLGIPIKRELRFLAWDKACKWFLIGPFICKLGAFPVNLERGGRESIKTAQRVLREGATLMIFPEGSREFADGKLLPFKPGTVRMAIDAGVPILPVTITGGNKVWSQEVSYPSFKKVKVTFHPLMEVKLPENMNARTYAEHLTEKLAEIIGSVQD
jgi:1-acyl-sn-glycerol-3-phosphate acyltransferase